MPLYEYRCPNCGHAFEKLQKVTAPHPECPSCGTQAERRMSRTSFRLKGAGWYATDYASARPQAAEGASPSASSGDPESSKSATTPGTSTDSSGPAAPAKSDP